MVTVSMKREIDYPDTVIFNQGSQSDIAVVESREPGSP